MAKRQTKQRANRQVKDTVFRMLFRSKHELRKLYSSLFPDAPPVTADEIVPITLENVLAHREHNDVAFMVRGQLMILVEAQSTWSVNTLIRLLIYLLHEYYEYIKKHKLNLFSSRKVPMPVQYVGSALVFDEQVKAHGRTQTAMIETIRICRDRDLLREFLDAHEKEAYDAMQLFTEEFIKEAILKEVLEDGEKKGMKKGLLQGGLNTLFGLVRKGRLTLAEASAEAGLSLKAFNAKMAEYEASLQA